MSLRLKMILGIGGILLLVVLQYSVVALRVQESHQLATAQREAELVASVAERAISIAMEQGKSEEIQKILERIGREPAVSAIRILAPTGSVLRSSDPREVGRVLPPAERNPGEDRQGPAAEGGEKTVGLVRRISNAPACYSCHPSEQSVLGVLQVRVASAPAESRAQGQLTVMILTTIVGLIVAGVLIALLFTLVVGRRLDAITRTMRLVEAGDLEARVPSMGSDELGRLGRGFNAMLTRLAEEQRGRENRHAEEIRQAEQMASLGKMAAVGTITSGIAHELNNPLNNISLTTEALLEDSKEMAEEVRWNLLQDIYFEVERASEIVRSLLDFTRAERPEMKPLVVEELIQSVFRLVQNELEIHQVRLDSEFPSDFPRISGAANQLRQVFLNLFLNGMQAMPEGGTLTVKGSLADPHRVCVQIRDQGVGIPPDVLPHIFDPFFTTKEPGKGTGLGLWVTLGIIRKHGGEIRAESERGRGTVISVYLPAEGADPQPSD